MISDKAGPKRSRLDPLITATPCDTVPRIFLHGTGIARNPPFLLRLSLSLALDVADTGAVDSQKLPRAIGHGRPGTAVARYLI